MGCSYKVGGGAFVGLEKMDPQVADGTGVLPQRMFDEMDLRKVDLNAF